MENNFILKANKILFLTIFFEKNTPNVPKMVHLLNKFECVKIKCFTPKLACFIYLVNELVIAHVVKIQKNQH